MQVPYVPRSPDYSPPPIRKSIVLPLAAGLGRGVHVVRASGSIKTPPAHNGSAGGSLKTPPAHGGDGGRYSPCNFETDPIATHAPFPDKA